MLLEKKITRFSLTDHDTIDGIQKARMLSRDRITFISGIEFTCQEKTLDTVSLPFSIHLLGYGFDENDPDLIKALEARKQRVLEVFESLLNAANISIEQAIRLIHKAGGRAVWAHPLFVYRNFEKRKLEKEEIQVIRERDPAIKSNMEVFLYPSFKAILHYRVAHKLYKKGHYVMARWISQRAVRKTGIEIHPGATIGKGLFIDHGSGVIIGETAELGDNITLYQGVTLGGTGKEQGKRHPTLGDNVMVSAGAKVLGSFKIGENSKIGAGSVVLKEVPANCTVVGVPGRIVKQDGAKIPRMDMNQVDLPDPISNDIKELQVDNLRMHKKLMELENQLKMVAHAQCTKEEKEQ